MVQRFFLGLLQVGDIPSFRDHQNRFALLVKNRLDGEIDGPDDVTPGEQLFLITYRFSLTDLADSSPESVLDFS